MADDGAAKASAAAENSIVNNSNNKNNSSSSSSNNNNNANKKNSNHDDDKKQEGGHGIVIGLVGHALRGGVGLLKWAGDIIGEPVEQGAGGQHDNEVLPQQAEDEPAAPNNSGKDKEEPGAAPPIRLVAQPAPPAEEGLAMAPNLRGRVSLDAEPSAEEELEGEGEDAGETRPTRDRATAAMVRSLESRFFWVTILLLAVSSFVAGYAACHLLEGAFGATPAYSCTRGDLVPAIPNADSVRVVNEHAGNRCGGLCFVVPWIKSSGGAAV